MPKGDGKTIQERFNERYVVDPVTGFWNWTAGINGRGYAYIWIPKNRPNPRSATDGSTVQAYKIGWLLKFNLEWEDLAGLDLHHDCENTRCVNPDHLIPQTRKEHRDSHYLTKCRKGHPYTEENTYYFNNPRRRACKTCMKLAGKNYRMRKAKSNAV